jgi:hypothetical protein
MHALKFQFANSGLSFMPRNAGHVQSEGKTVPSLISMILQRQPRRVGLISGQLTPKWKLRFKGVSTMCHFHSFQNQQEAR